MRLKNFISEGDKVLTADSLERPLVGQEGIYGKKELICTYPVPPFKVCIYDDRSGIRYYSWSSCLNEKEMRAVRDIIKDLEQQSIVPEHLPSSLHEYMQWFVGLISPCLAQRGLEAEYIARFAAYEWIGLGRLYPIFEDGKVDEFFSDSCNSYPYLEHRDAGRCQLNMHLTKRELDSIRTQAEIYGQQQASINTPAIKNELSFGRFKIRVGMDFEPVAIDGPSLHLRKIAGEAFTLAKLLDEGAITIEAASLILAAAYCRINITILGPSGTGKTTLLNAIDLALDPRLRRIYIEDSVESLDLTAYGYRQVKLRVQPIEAGYDSERNKMNEVLKTLHRSPDILILGEIQDSLQCSAFFQALESGIVGLQTFHSSSPEQAVRRWVNLMHIRPEQLNDLGIIVTMKRPDQLSSMRVINRISEVDESMTVNDLYARDSGAKGLIAGPSDRLIKKCRELSDSDFEEARKKMEDILCIAMNKKAYGIDAFAKIIWEKVCRNEE